MRGPRKAAELTGDIKHRMSLASQAFINGNYDEAQTILNDIIRINAETFEAWMLLANVWTELGNLDKAVASLTFAAHLRPHHADVWLNVARFTLEETGSQRVRFLKSAKSAYAGAIRANPKETTEARLGKALVLREMDNPAAAISEYKQVLRAHPHDMSVLRLMAETFLDLNNAEAAQKLYRHSIIHYQAAPVSELRAFHWIDVNIFAELFSYLGQHAEAIQQLKKLARWLLGRQEDAYWDNYAEDDREWDAEDDRRLEILDFATNRYGPDKYGHGLPIELRVKLGLYRLRLGHYNEATVRFNANSNTMC